MFGASSSCLAGLGSLRIPASPNTRALARLFMLSDRIKADMVAALKAGEVLRLSVLRLLVSELNYKKIEMQKELTDEDVMGVIFREVKKRKEAVESYTAGGRQEQAEQEQREMEILKEYVEHHG